MRKTYALAFMALAPVLAALSPACSNQGPGERCDPLAGRNGDDDCASGLTCVPPGQLQWPSMTDGGRPQTTTTGICCPADRNQGPEVCRMSSSNIMSDATISDDAMTSDGSMNDAPLDADSGSNDAQSDASSDAPTDAPEGG